MMPSADSITTTDFQTKSSDGHNILLRWFMPAQAHETSKGSAWVYIHGGGMISGSVPMLTPAIAKMVVLAGVPFLAVDYRLAPEVQAPVPVTDSYAGLLWLHTHAAELGVDPKRIGVVGESAGGGISASLAHFVKQRHEQHDGRPEEIPTLQRQVLVYPMLDDRTTTSAPEAEIEPFLLWNRDDNETGWSALLGSRRGGPDVTVIEAAGRMTVEQARGLPPTYIDVGELDLFRNEDLVYAQMLGLAGVSCELHMVPGAPHAFDGIGPGSEIVELCMKARVRHLRSI
jgi:acetyl esterase/lipase